MADKTELIIADADRPLAYLELSDEALGRFCRGYLIMLERCLHKHAGNNNLDLSVATGMHGCISLYRLAAQANAGELIFEHKGVEWGGEQQGDWTLTIRRHPLRGEASAD